MPATATRRPWIAFLAGLALTACNTTASPPVASPSDSAASTGAPSTAPAPSSVTSVSPPASPSVAPTVDGQIVFEDAGQNFLYSQIWIENADGTNVRKVVSDTFTDSGASLSPDGTKIVFYRLEDPKLAGAIMIVNTNGSGLHELATASRSKGCDAGPEGDAWSPDGRRIAYARFCFDPAGKFVEAGIWTINADGTDARQVTSNRAGSSAEDHHASWSPDGKSLVFERLDISATPEAAAIFTIGVDGKHLRQVTPWKLDGNDPVWSPDGSLIAFNASAEPSPTQNIYTIKPDGTGLEKLTNYNEDGQATFHPSWSPNGTRILFSHNPSTDGWADFFIMNRDGSNQHVVAMTALHENHGQWGKSPAP
jgi:TolB protein